MESSKATSIPYQDRTKMASPSVMYHPTSSGSKESTTNDRKTSISTNDAESNSTRPSSHSSPSPTRVLSVSALKSTSLTGAEASGVSSELKALVLLGIAIFGIALLRSIISDPFALAGVLALSYIYFVALPEVEDSSTSKTSIAAAQRAPSSSLRDGASTIEEQIEALKAAEQLLLLEEQQDDSIAELDDLRLAAAGLAKPQLPVHSITELQNELEEFVYGIRYLFPRQHSLYAKHDPLEFTDANADLFDPLSDLHWMGQIAHGRSLARHAQEMDYPTFDNGDMQQTLDRIFRRDRYDDPIYDNTRQFEYRYGHESDVGRPVGADQKDIDALLDATRDHLPEEFLNRFYDFEDDYRRVLNARREFSTGLNYTYEALVLEYHRICTPLGRPVSSLQDVYKHEIERTQRHSFPVKIHWRSEEEAKALGCINYLSNLQEGELNEACADYWSPHPVTISSAVFDFIQTHQEFQKKTAIDPQTGANRVASWVTSIDVEDIFDPIDCEPCACGHEALVAIQEYRGENPSRHDDEFPLICSSKQVLKGRRIVNNYEKTALAELYPPPPPPKCQTILQSCTLHAMATDSIFVLVDTTEHDINTKLSNPNGALPAPGLQHSKMFPPGHKIMRGFQALPDEQLPPRCEHEGHHPWGVSKDYCHECFPRGWVCECLGCMKHREYRAAEELKEQQQFGLYGLYGQVM